MMFLLGLGALTGLAVYKAKRPVHIKASPTVSYAFQRLLDAKLPADKYAAAAVIFRDSGLASEADILQKRAQLASLAPNEKAKLRSAFAQAMQSDKPEGIRMVADAMQDMGAIGSSMTLRDHADTVSTAKHIKASPVEPDGNAISPDPFDNSHLMHSDEKTSEGTAQSASL